MRHVICLIASQFILFMAVQFLQRKDLRPLIFIAFALLITTLMMPQYQLLHRLLFLTWRHLSCRPLSVLAIASPTVAFTIVRCIRCHVECGRNVLSPTAGAIHHLRSPRPSAFANLHICPPLPMPPLTTICTIGRSAGQCDKPTERGGCDERRHCVESQ